MRVFVGCEYSGVVRDAFAAAGHDAWSCDILPTDSPGNHYQGDIFEALEELGSFDLGIFHPPCTYLCNSGARHLHTDDSRWGKLDDAGDFFRRILDLPISRIAVENPIPHKYAVERIGRKYDQIVQPWMFGHAESKSTCLWLKGLPKLKETDNVREEFKALPKKVAQRILYMPPSKDRWRLRSTTYKGIAEAMAQQWGCPQ